jgi:hypothetical protein
LFRGLLAYGGVHLQDVSTGDIRHQGMRVLCGHEEKEDRTNGYYILREVHRLWDAGLLGLHPIGLTMHVAEFPELKEQYQKYNNKRISLAAKQRQEPGHFCKPPLLWWRWYRFLAASTERAAKRSEYPFFCILCCKGFKTLEGYQKHTTYKYALKKHKHVPTGEWYGKACVMAVSSESVVLPDYGPAGPPKTHTCVLCKNKYTGDHTCDTCGGLCHKIRVGACLGCPHKTGLHKKSAESVETSDSYDTDESIGEDL